MKKEHGWQHYTGGSHGPGSFGAARGRRHDHQRGRGDVSGYPIYSQWAYKYNSLTGVKLNYQSIGSGGGIAQIKAKTVDFGASDEPLKPEALKQKRFGPVSHGHRRRGAGRKSSRHRSRAAQAHRRAAGRYLTSAKSPSGTTRPSRASTPA